MYLWERKELKERAKKVLSGSYWKAFVVSLILAIVTAQTTSNGSNDNTSGSNGGILSFDISLEYLIALVAVFSTFAVVFLIFKIIVGYNLEVGCRKYFIKSAENDVNMGYMGYTFKSGRYWNISKTLLIKNIFLFLWCLVFIIPVFIKLYSYRFVPYILADNPEMDSLEAITLSRKMADGNKLEMFIMDLSFLGWIILGLVCFVVGIVFVFPYINSTYAELYLVLRNKVISENIVEPEELNQ